jgi:hypothetical protein
MKIRTVRENWQKKYNLAGWIFGLVDPLLPGFR